MQTKQFGIKTKITFLIQLFNGVKVTDEPYIVNNLELRGGNFLSIIVASLVANYAFLGV